MHAGPPLHAVWKDGGTGPCAGCAQVAAQQQPKKGGVCGGGQPAIVWLQPGVVPRTSHTPQQEVSRDLNAV
jgi:hypothetical protein